MENSKQIFWRVSEDSPHNGFLVIERLAVNNATFPVTVSSAYDQRFRMVFELWVYDRPILS
jgi:hypothetical protein